MTAATAVAQSEMNIAMATNALATLISVPTNNMSRQKATGNGASPLHRIRKNDIMRVSLARLMGIPFACWTVPLP